MSKTQTIAALLALSCLAGCGEPAWLEVAPAGETFRFEVPAEPLAAGDRLDTGAGEARLRSWNYQTEERSFLVGYTDFPPQYGETFGAAELLDGARDRAVAQSQGRLRHEEARSIQGFPGRYIDVEAAGGLAIVRGQLLLADERLYYVLATVPPAESEAPDVARFLDSFQLVEAQ